MKHQLLVLLVSFTLATPGSRAANPVVVPYNYESDVGGFLGITNNPDLSHTFEVFRFWEALGGVWGADHFYQPDVDGFPFDQWTWIDWGTAQWPVVNSGDCFWTLWWGDDYFEGSCEDPYPPLSFVYEYAALHYEGLTNLFGDVGEFEHWYGINTEVWFWAGGATNAPATNLFRLHAELWDKLGHGYIPPAAIKFWGTEQCDTNGDVYFAMPDNNWYMATPKANHAGYSNYTFGVSVDKAQLQIWRGGADITGQTNTVVVGEQIALTCRFDTNTLLPTSIITNFQWTVPGNVVSGFTNTSNYGEGLGLTNTTNSTVLFYWVEGGSAFDVICSAIVKGISLQAKSTFVVTGAVGTLTAAFHTNVVVDPDLPRVQLGNANVPGIVFIGTGETPGNWHFCQILQGTDVRANVATNLTGGNPVSLVRTVTNALDGSYPYPTVQSVGNTNATIDSPFQGTGDTVKFWRDDSFTMFFMFQPTNVGASIPVPVRKLSWSWGAIVTNATILASSYTNLGAQNQPATLHPSWRTNTAFATNWQSNPFHYP